MGRRPPTKLHMPLKGPFRVIRISPDGNKYDVLNLVNHEEYRFPVSRLVKFWIIGGPFVNDGIYDSLLNGLITQKRILRGNLMKPYVR